METSNHTDASWLNQKYVVERWTTTQIAAECGVSHKTVSRWMVKLGIEIRDRQTAQIKNSKHRRLMLQDIRDCSAAD